MEKPTLNPEEMILELRYSGGRADQGRIPVAVRIRALEALQRAQRQMVEHNLGIAPRPGPPNAAVAEAAQLDSMPTALGSLVERVAPAATVGMIGIGAFNSIADSLTGAANPPERVGESLQGLIETLDGAQSLTITKQWDAAAPSRTYQTGEVVSGFDLAEHRPDEPFETSYFGRLSAIDLRRRHGTLIKAGSKPLAFEFEYDLDGQLAKLVGHWIRINCAASLSPVGRPVAIAVDDLPEFDDSTFWHPPGIEERIESSGVQPYQPVGRNRFLSDHDLDELLPEGPLL